ncbi:MAG: nucleoside triphosphate pyrophosphohydrolase [Rhodospirillaceae bacterium]|nr:nucleoside triphosphate pyrophosphohydrolase [Rhodospirillaceae bacterium]
MQGNISQLLEIMTRLRDPENGCPWDIEQDFTSIAPYTIEEAYEVDEAIRADDMDALKDELGDLLLQVVFHAEMAREAGHFNFSDVVAGISEKMTRRHPHVFADSNIRDADQQSKAWEVQKAEERAAEAGKHNNRAPSALDGVANALPALMRAEKNQKRASRVGFDWCESGPMIEKIAEELVEINDAKSEPVDPKHLRLECGDLLFSCVNLVRHLGVDAEHALRDSNAKFENRFRRMESVVQGENKRVEEKTLEQLEEIWQQVKADE